MKNIKIKLEKCQKMTKDWAQGKKINWPVAREPKIRRGICKICQTKKNVRYYVIADDLERHQPYCGDCWEKFQTEIIIKISNLKNERETIKKN
jgi:hypothetical protein